MPATKGSEGKPTTRAPAREAGDLDGEALAGMVNRYGHRHLTAKGTGLDHIARGFRVHGWTLAEVEARLCTEVDLTDPKITDRYVVGVLRRLAGTDAPKPTPTPPVYRAPEVPEPHGDHAAGLASVLGALAKSKSVAEPPTAALTPGMATGPGTPPSAGAVQNGRAHREEHAAEVTS